MNDRLNSFAKSPNNPCDFQIQGEQTFDVIFRAFGMIFNQNIFSDILVSNKIGIYKRAFVLLQCIKQFLLIFD